MFKRLLVLVVANCLLVALMAQEKKELIPEDYKLQLKFNPISLFTPRYPGLLIGAEYPLQKKLTLIHELGGFQRIPTVFSNPDNNVTGFRGRSGLRWYASGSYKNRTDFYLSFWMQFKKEFHKELKFVERFGGSFLEKIEVKETRTFFGGYCSAGWQGRMSNKSRWEIDAGLGVRQRWVYDHPLPDDARIVNNNNFGGLFSNGGGLVWPDLFPVFTLDFRFNFIVK